MKIASSLVLAVAAMAACGPSAGAQEFSPLGLWKTINDVDGKLRSIVLIMEVDGELQGRIEKIFPNPDEEPNPKCNKCQGVRKDQPIVGLVFMTGLKKVGGEFTDGQILDPDDGKVYQSKMELTDGGKKLKVRGYVGMPLFGRTQTWLRSQ